MHRFYLVDIFRFCLACDPNSCAVVVKVSIRDERGAEQEQGKQRKAGEAKVPCPGQGSAVQFALRREREREIVAWKWIQDFVGLMHIGNGIDGEGHVGIEISNGRWARRCTVRRGKA
jgi:hypothetical protein